jgi:hypothetical protein
MDLALDWELVADGVMGGVSQGALTFEEIGGRKAARLTGRVSLENNGGFLQMAADFAGGGLFDASGYSGLALEVFGNAERYDTRLRTDALSRPWQSFRTSFIAPEEWQWVHLPFPSFQPHKTDAVFDPARLRRIGLVAIGRAFDVDLAVSRVRLVEQ